MKNENNQSPLEKRCVNDFKHRIEVTLREKDYVDYAVSHSKDQIAKGKKRAVFWALLCGALGLMAMFKGTTLEGRVGDIYLTAGILLVIFQLFNLFYNFVMFEVALKRSVLKELKKDPSLLQTMVYAFEPEKIVCFLNGKHRSSVMTKNIIGLEESNDTMILEVSSGKRIIIPKEAYESADPQTKAQIRSFKK